VDGPRAQSPAADGGGARGGYRARELRTRECSACCAGRGHRRPADGPRAESPAADGGGARGGYRPRGLRTPSCAGRRHRRPVDGPRAQSAAADGGGARGGYRPRGLRTRERSACLMCPETPERVDFWCKPVLHYSRGKRSGNSRAGSHQAADPGAGSEGDIPGHCSFHREAPLQSPRADGQFTDRASQHLPRLRMDTFTPRPGLYSSMRLLQFHWGV
jgi:hypothetical protein